jgi:hypothetical protein
MNVTEDSGWYEVTTRPLLRLLITAASCDRLGHEWEQVDDRLFRCLWCGEPGYDGSERAIRELENRWSGVGA